MRGGGEHGVDGVAVGVGKVIAAHAVMFLEMTDDRLDGGTPFELALDLRRDAALVVSRIFRTFNLAERHPDLGHAVMAPLICWSFSNSMFRYLLVDHAVPAMWRSLAAARLSAD